MNPYQAPESPNKQSNKESIKYDNESGPPCPACRSANTSRDSVLRSSPSILAVILFGWVFMLARGAFAMRSSRCRDCGELNRYKSIGSWVALVCFVTLVLLIIGAAVSDF
jgi:hypothetical protein